MAFNRLIIKNQLRSTIYHICILKMATKVTWLGHATLKIETGQGEDAKVIVIDPWYGSPVYPAAHNPIPKADIILVTHGHFDHSGSVLELAQATGAKIVTVAELIRLFRAQGHENVHMMNKGGTYDLGYCQIT